MKKIIALSFLVLCCTAAIAQGFNPIARYNHISESAYLLNRCGAMNPQRLAWLKHIRSLALQGLGWDEARAEEQEDILIKEFDARYREVPKERCAEVVRGVDLERAKFGY
jgi:hypothetical protein